MPPSVQWRLDLQKNLLSLADSLCLFGHTPLNCALDMPASVLKRFFEGEVFEVWKKNHEAKNKMQAAQIERLNEIIRGCGIIAKTIARS